MPAIPPHQFITLNHAAREDLRTWQLFLNSYNGITFFRSPQIADAMDINLASDACKLGFGGVYGSNWIQCRYPKLWNKFHINVLELFPVLVMINVFGPKLTNSCIRFYCDNKPVTQIINKQSSKDKIIMQIVRPLVLALIRFNISLTCEHIPGKLNIIPDRLSRFQATGEMLKSWNMKPQPTAIPPSLLPENYVIC